MSSHCRVAVYRGGNFSHFLKFRKAEQKVRIGAYRWREGELAIEETLVLAKMPSQSVGFFDGVFGTGNALPFTRVPNKMLKPQKLHYEIPACGARSRPMYVVLINRGRELDELRAQRAG